VWLLLVKTPTAAECYKMFNKAMIQVIAKF
jgi:hypothetical protein